MSIRFSLHTSAEKTMTIADTPTAAHMSNNISGQRSPWHSPVPYLFGGLAAMLGLIAFALLVLACSYWRLSGYLDNERDADADEEAGSSDHGADNMKKTGAQASTPVYEEKYLVIMAGQHVPTCLATPMWSRASSFGSTSKSSSCSTTITTSSTEGGASSFVENTDKIQQEESNHHVIDMAAAHSSFITNPPHHPHHQQEQQQQHVSSSSQS